MHESDQLPPSNAEVQRMWNYNTAVPYAFISWYLRIESLWGRDFREPSRAALGAAQPLCSWYWLPFPGVKRPGRGVEHPPPSSAEVKERVEF